MPAPPKNHNWIWFFAVLIILALFASILMIVINVKLQLKPEQLEANRMLWDTKGPANYVMAYTTRKNDENSTDHYVVKVHNKKTYEVLVNGLPLTERLDYYGMDALFTDVERFLDMDTAKGKSPTYARAVFESQTGAIRSYTRHVMGGRERLEINVEPLDVK